MEYFLSYNHLQQVIVSVLTEIHLLEYGVWDCGQYTDIAIYANDVHDLMIIFRCNSTQTLTN